MRPPAPPPDLRIFQFVFDGGPPKKIVQTHKTKWKFFYLGDLRYHGHDVDILWKEDWSSTTPGMQSKLFVWVDGKRVAQSNDLNSSLQVSL